MPQPSQRARKAGPPVGHYQHSGCPVTSRFLRRACAERSRRDGSRKCRRQVGLITCPQQDQIAHAASPPTLAKNARMGHPRREWCTQSSLKVGQPHVLGRAVRRIVGTCHNAEIEDSAGPQSKRLRITSRRTLLTHNGHTPVCAAKRFWWGVTGDLSHTTHLGCLSRDRTIKEIGGSIHHDPSPRGRKRGGRDKRWPLFWPLSGRQCSPKHAELRAGRESRRDHGRR
jgi:hypothetical protein